MKKEALIISDLKVSIDAQQILRGVNLEITSGEIHAVMGPNGSGKTTLALTLAGHPHYQLDGGQIRLDGKLLNDLSPDQRAQAGLFLAFQYPVEVPGVRVWQFLWQAYQACKTASQRKSAKLYSALKFKKNLERIASELDVSSELLSRNLNEGFSGGEKKRVEVIQLLALKPKYAILDETDSGLDVDAIRVVAKAINQAVTDNGTGVLLITHYRRILEYVKPDKVHIMSNGKVIKTGGAQLIDQVENDGYNRLKEK